MRRRIRLLILLSILGFLCSCSIFGGGSLSGSYFTYRVRPGDTLFALGQRYGVSADTLQDINDIDDPRELKIGQVLKIPGSPSRSGSAAGGGHRASEVSLKTVRLTLARKYIGHLQFPVPGGSISSHFGQRGVSFHEGIDISARIGTPIRAAHDGVIVYSDDSLRGYGNLIVLKGDGLLTVYGHNDENLVRAGRAVRRGDTIARVGKSGKATGPHLHFETRVRDSSGHNAAVDPLVFYGRG